MNVSPSRSRPASQGSATSHPPKKLAKGDKIVWTKGKLLGRGASGSVYLGLETRSGTLIAVKEIAFEPNGLRVNERVASLRNEIRVLKELEAHPHIVSYYSSARVGGSVFLFMEYVAGGTLASLVAQFGELREDLAASFGRQLLLGLDHMHTKGVVHGDVKASNVLVTIDGTVKLADFGSAKFPRGGAFAPAKSNSRSNSGTALTGDHRGGSTAVDEFSGGTANWMAPEVIRGGQAAATPMDVWSFGCTMIELLTGAAPFEHIGTSIRVLGYIGGEEPLVLVPPEARATMSDAAFSMLSWCLQRDPTRRPTAAALISHPFFASAAGLGAGDGSNAALRASGPLANAAVSVTAVDSLPTSASSPPHGSAPPTVRQLAALAVLPASPLRSASDPSPVAAFGVSVGTVPVGGAADSPLKPPTTGMEEQQFELLPTTRTRLSVSGAPPSLGEMPGPPTAAGGARAPPRGESSDAVSAGGFQIPTLAGPLGGSHTATPGGLAAPAGQPFGVRQGSSGVLTGGLAPPQMSLGSGEGSGSWAGAGGAGRADLGQVRAALVRSAMRVRSPLEDAAGCSAGRSPNQSTLLPSVGPLGPASAFVDYNAAPQQPGQQQPPESNPLSGPPTAGGGGRLSEGRTSLARGASGASFAGLPAAAPFLECADIEGALQEEMRQRLSASRSVVSVRADSAAARAGGCSGSAPPCLPTALEAARPSDEVFEEFVLGDDDPSADVPSVGNGTTGIGGSRTGSDSVVVGQEETPALQCRWQPIAALCAVLAVVASLVVLALSLS